ncbi:hypothetical protein CXB51_004989 [Gossypium anomalum]|uniref:Uncharacterized protein n=1 Tax=Gossypium anomalum TaxID=47600 RepID=A0A8J5YXX6_9ROSI|nr:hypothetical protein CXB51_004989 [Gossypium anomalum]
MESFLWLTDVLRSPKGWIRVVLDVWPLNRMLCILWKKELSLVFLCSFGRCGKQVHHDFQVHNLLYALFLPRRLVVVRWTSPCEDAIKIIVDVVWNVEMGFVLCSAIIRDHEGMVLACFSCSLRILMLLQLMLLLWLVLLRGLLRRAFPELFSSLTMFFY